MEERKTYLDALRVLAFFMVCVIHILGYEVSLRPVDSLSWRLGNLADGASRCCIPLFFMLSGALLLDEARPMDWKRFLRKNVLRLVSAYLFWSALYTLRVMLPLNASAGEWIAVYLEGGDHLWFIFAMLGMYALLPILRPIAAQPGLRRYFILLSFVMGSALPALLLLPGSERAAAALDQFQLSGIGAYACCFMLGRELDELALPPGKRAALYILGALSAGAIVAGTRQLSLRAGAFNGLLYGYALPMSLAAAGALFVLGKSVFGRIPRDSRIRRPLGLMSQWTFGAYLSHNLIKYALYDRGLWAGGAPFPIRALCGLAAVFAGGYIISFLLSRIPGVRKYLV